MKIKKWLIISVILILSFLLINFILGLLGSKNIFDSRATQDTVSVSVQIVAGDTTPPSITVNEPKSRVYIWGSNLWIRYSVVDDTSNLSSVWFNLDNGTNITLPLPPQGTNNNEGFMNASTGNHVFYIFANDTKNNINDSINVNFSIVDSFKKDLITPDTNGNLIFTDPEINEFIQNISGLDPDWTTNFTLFDNETPSGWDAPTNVGEEMFYFEILANTVDDTTGNYKLYFNLSKANLGAVASEDIRGFFFNNNIWNELTTTVENDNTDPLEFSVSLTHLSRFLIAEKDTTSTSRGTSTATGSGGKKAKVPKILDDEEPPIPEPEIPKKLKEETPSVIQPIISKLKEIIELPLLNIIIVFSILTVLVLIIVWFESKSKKKKIIKFKKYKK